MKTAWGAITLAVLLGHGAIALAQDPRDPHTFDIQDGDEEEQIRKLEERLNEVLVVEENGRVVVKEEFRNSLPFPAERVQQMLSQFVELGADGKIKVRNVEQVRPYLPLIQRFLSPESMERLREIQKLPPEQRAEAMRRMFGGGGAGPGATPAPPPPQPQPRPAPAPQPPAPQPQPRGEDEGWDETERPLPRGSLHRDRRQAREEEEEDDDRLSRLEHRLERMERMLRDSLERRHDSRGPSGNADRGRALRDLFGLGRRRDEGDSARRRMPSLSEVNRRAKVWRKGLQKLTQILEPDDFERIGRAMERMRGGLTPEDVRDREKLMQRLQESADPEDVARFMEIFSEFIATPEGREFADELERMVERMEEVVNSGDGERFGEALDRLGQGQLRERLDELMRGRDRERAERAPAPREEHRRERERERRPHSLPEGAKLY